MTTAGRNTGMCKDAHPSTTRPAAVPGSSEADHGTGKGDAASNTRLTSSELWFIDVARSLAALEACERDHRLLPATFDPRSAPERRAAHIALRLILARPYIGTDHGQNACAQPREIVQGRNGRPEIVGGDREFSLSHTEGFALIGIAPRATLIGVDLERTARAVRMLPDRQRAIRAAAAALGNRLAPLDETHHGFLQAWTRMEAVAKADGRGMAWLLAELGAWKRRADPMAGTATGERADALLSRLDVEVRDIAVQDIDAQGVAQGLASEHAGIVAAAAVPNGRKTLRPQWLPDSRDGLDKLAAGG